MSKKSNIHRIFDVEKTRVSNWEYKDLVRSATVLDILKMCARDKGNKYTAQTVLEIIVRNEDMLEEDLRRVAEGIEESVEKEEVGTDA